MAEQNIKVASMHDASRYASMVYRPNNSGMNNYFVCAFILLLRIAICYVVALLKSLNTLTSCENDVALMN